MTINYFNKPFQQIYSFLSSVKLALLLLIMILICCIVGVTIFRGAQAGALIFSSLWFNGLLVLLVVNIAFCFFGRIWGRKVTLISFGMILFHLSFVAMLCGIIYNSMFYFRGVIRLTEGETLPSGDPQSYDYLEHGRLFNLNKLKGETTLKTMHTGYQVDGADRFAAYDIAVGEGTAKKQGVIYITKSMEHSGFRYFNDREGYSVAVVLYNKKGAELYGAFVPLQSIKQIDAKGNAVYLYTTGTKDRPGSFPFPQDPLEPLFALQIAYMPSALKFKEREGEAFLQVWPLAATESHKEEKPIVSGKIPVGQKILAGDHYLSVKEVRYWVAMNVRYDPGQPIVLTSLWVGLGGMIITFIGRMRRRPN